MRRRGEHIVTAEMALDGRRDRPDARRGVRRLALGEGHRDIARGPLLQQQRRGPHHRFGVESLPHQPVEDDVVDADDGHSLVVGHVATDQGEAVLGSPPAGREIDRFVEPVPPAGPEFGEGR